MTFRCSIFPPLIIVWYDLRVISPASPQQLLLENRSILHYGWKSKVEMGRKWNENGTLVDCLLQLEAGWTCFFKWHAKTRPDFNRGSFHQTCSQSKMADRYTTRPTRNIVSDTRYLPPTNRINKLRSPFFLPLPPCMYSTTRSFYLKHLGQFTIVSN